MKSIAMLHGLGRCGGTIISRCIGCMNAIAMLHEINPDGPSLVRRMIPRGGHLFNALYQTVSWFPSLFTKKDEIWINRKINEDNDLDTLKRIYKRVTDSGMHLVIRDWPHMNFIGTPFVQNPDYRMAMKEMLESEFTLNEGFILRDPIGNYISMISCGEVFAPLTTETGVKEYLKGYRRFAEHAVKATFIKYEDFTESPQTAIRTLVDAMQIPYDADFINKWGDYVNMTGDKKRIDSKIISLSKHKELDAQLQHYFLSSDDYARVYELTGYTRSF